MESYGFGVVVAVDSQGVAVVVIAYFSVLGQGISLCISVKGLPCKGAHFPVQFVVRNVADGFAGIVRA